MDKKITVIVFSDYDHSACSYWRSLGPLSYLSREGHIDIIKGTWDDTWTTLQMADIAFFQRPMMASCFNQVAMAKDLGLKVVIDVDDHNIIPSTHPVYDDYYKGYDEGTFIKIAMFADVIMTTTKYLQQHYSMYNPNIQIVPNAINDYYLQSYQNKDTKTVFLRGGKHKEFDIYSFKDEIIDVMKANPDWLLEVSGGDPVFLREEIPNYRSVGDLDIHAYFAYILQSEASIFIAPLVNNKLNKGKSQISWQEATISGAVALVPDFMEADGAFKYSDKESFKEQFQRLIDNEDDIINSNALLIMRITSGKALGRNLLIMLILIIFYQTSTNKDWT